jgi:hypothetical protein
VLFVGEAPPSRSSTASFFYDPGASRHRVVQRVFEKAFDLRFADDEFLGWFRRAGCYLEDLSHDPVDGLTDKERSALYALGVERLAATFVELRPAIVISLLRRIAPHVRAAAERSGLHAELIEVPYPGRWPAHRIAFERTLVEGLRRWHGSGVLVLPGGKPG